MFSPFNPNRGPLPRSQLQTGRAVPDHLAINGTSFQSLIQFAPATGTLTDVARSELHHLRVNVSIHGLSCDVTPLRRWGAKGCR
jgi:hypothetical protein